MGTSRLGRVSWRHSQQLWGEKKLREGLGLLWKWSWGAGAGCRFELGGQLGSGHRQ